MKITRAVTVLMAAFATTAHAEIPNIDDLYGQWCLRSLAVTLDGPRTEDNSLYNFTREGKLKYKMGAFEQTGDYSVTGDEIKTLAMGNYKIISLAKDRMTLKYLTYFFFEKGACRGA